jgi:hypothetical protein
MEADNFLKRRGIQVQNLITLFEIEKEFSSHDFIEKLTEKYEAQYIEMLVEHKNSGKSFQTVHRLIAKHLSDNTVSLGIVKTEKKESENVRGNLDIIQWWKRVN